MKHSCLELWNKQHLKAISNRIFFSIQATAKRGIGIQTCWAVLEPQLIAGCLTTFLLPDKLVPGTESVWIAMIHIVKGLIHQGELWIRNEMRWITWLPCDTPWPWICSDAPWGMLQRCSHISRGAFKPQIPLFHLLFDHWEQTKMLRRSPPWPIVPQLYRPHLGLASF